MTNKRDNNRLKLIRNLPCVSCGHKAPSQACHSNFQEHGKGMGTKADDYYTIPLCHQCHISFDQYIDVNRHDAKRMFNEWHAQTELMLSVITQEMPF